LIESTVDRSYVQTDWFSEEHSPGQVYLIAGHSIKGLELPHIFSDSGEEVLSVFSSVEAAREFLSSSPLGEGWEVRTFCGGELVSVLLAFYSEIEGVLLDPHPGDLSGDLRMSLVGREYFVRSLIETGSHAT
jgi:hypothetical protein